MEDEQDQEEEQSEPEVVHRHGKCSGRGRSQRSCVKARRKHSRSREPVQEESETCSGDATSQDSPALGARCSRSEGGEGLSMSGLLARHLCTGSRVDVVDEPPGDGGDPSSGRRALPCARPKAAPAAGHRRGVGDDGGGAAVGADDGGLVGLGARSDDAFSSRPRRWLSTPPRQPFLEAPPPFEPPPLDLWLLRERRRVQDLLSLDHRALAWAALEREAALERRREWEEWWLRLDEQEWRFEHREREWLYCRDWRLWREQARRSHLEDLELRQRRQQELPRHLSRLSDPRSRSRGGERTSSADAHRQRPAAALDGRRPAVETAGSGRERLGPTERGAELGGRALPQGREPSREGRRRPPDPQLHAPRCTAVGGADAAATSAAPAEDAEIRRLREAHEAEEREKQQRRAERFGMVAVRRGSSDGLCTSVSASAGNASAQDRRQRHGCGATEAAAAAGASASSAPPPPLPPRVSLRTRDEVADARWRMQPPRHPPAPRSTSPPKGLIQRPWALMSHGVLASK